MAPRATGRDARVLLHPLRAVKPSLTRGWRTPTMHARRVRLLFVNANRSRSFGGVERWMIDAASGLAARGHRSVLLGRPGTPWLEAAARAGVPVRPGIRGAWAARVLRVGVAMRAEDADVVIVKGKKAARMAAFRRATGARGRGALLLGATPQPERARSVDRF